MNRPSTKEEYQCNLSKLESTIQWLIVEKIFLQINKDYKDALPQEFKLPRVTPTVYLAIMVTTANVNSDESFDDYLEGITRKLKMLYLQEFDKLTEVHKHLIYTFIIENYGWKDFDIVEITKDLKKTWDDLLFEEVLPTIFDFIRNMVADDEFDTEYKKYNLVEKAELVRNH